MARVNSRTFRSSTHTVSETINGVDHEFEVIFEPQEYNDIHVRISEDGKKAVVGYLCRDDDAGDPRGEFDQIDHMICFHSSYNLGDKHNYSSDEFLKELCREALGDDDKWERMLERADQKCEAIYMAGDRTNERGRREIYQDQDATMQELYSKVLDPYCVMLPLYLYDHSGLSMSTGSFNDRWDSGQVGYIYMTWQEACDNFGGVPGRQARTKQWRARIIQSLESSVKEYDMYLTGDVYGVCSQCFVNVAEEGDDPEWEEFEERGLIGYSGVDKDGKAIPIYGDIGRDECWGFYGDGYAEEELKSRMESYDEWLALPLTPPEDPDQLSFEFKEAA